VLRRLALAGLVVVPLVAGGCGVIGGSGAVEIERMEQVPVELSVKLRGDVNLTFDRKVLSSFAVRRTNERDVRRFQVVGVGPVEPVRVGTAAVLPGVAVVPYQGDGEYTIEPGSLLDQAKAQQDGAQRPTVQSSIKIDYWPTGDVQSEPESYMRRVKACTVKVKKQGTEGVATCPDVTTEARDKHFSFEFRWRAPKTPAPATTTTVPDLSVPSTTPTT
jgi:hypothetical protein